MEKVTYNVNDLMELFGCGKDTAQRIKREIKAVSDITRNVRIVHKLDYEIWLKKYGMNNGLEYGNDRNDKQNKH